MNEKITGIPFQKRESEINEACSYFGITKEETANGFWAMKNDKRTLQAFGIADNIEFLKTAGKEMKKVRITTYYDPDYPLVLQTVIYE